MAKDKSRNHKKNSLLLKAGRLKAEIERLVDFLYNTNSKDTYLRYKGFKTYRVEVQRSFILYVHLAIEDLLRALLFDFVAKQNKPLT
jgi:hypothetical protein